MNKFLAQIENEDEALALLTALGFSIDDFSFIKKIGGARELLASDLLGRFINQQVSNGFLISKALENFRSIMDEFYNEGGALITPLNNASSRLFKAKGSPLAYFGQHQRALLDKRPLVAIVGARRASRDALDSAKQLAASLAKREVVVVSGGAYGVDQHAHKGALFAGGNTIVVAGTTSEARNRQKMGAVFSNHEQRVAIIYPFGPFTAQGKFMFVKRNAYVAALADRLVIVQGKEDSGTLHTAGFAKDLKVPLFAIPGAVSDPLSFVPNHLLEQGLAACLVDFEQFADALMTNAKRPRKISAIKLKDHMKNSKLQADLPHILRVLSEHDNMLNFDQLLKLTSCPRAVLQRELLEYELAGRITKRGAQFVLTGR